MIIPQWTNGEKRVNISITGGRKFKRSQGLSIDLGKHQKQLVYSPHDYGPSYILQFNLRLLSINFLLIYYIIYSLIDKRIIIYFVIFH